MSTHGLAGFLVHPMPMAFIGHITTEVVLRYIPLSPKQEKCFLGATVVATAATAVLLSDSIFIRSLGGIQAVLMGSFTAYEVLHINNPKKSAKEFLNDASARYGMAMGTILGIVSSLGSHPVIGTVVGASVAYMTTLEGKPT